MRKAIAVLGAAVLALVLVAASSKVDVTTADTQPVTMVAIPSSKANVQALLAQANAKGLTEAGYIIMVREQYDAVGFAEYRLDAYTNTKDFTFKPGSTVWLVKIRLDPFTSPVTP